MAYTNISKPGAQTYTNIGKPSGSFTIRKGMATGLMIPLTYSVTNSIGNAYTNISKPSAQVYINILKPT